MKIIAITATGMLMLGLYVGWARTEIGCNIQNGRWASNGSYCITRDCYETNSCGEWANPGLRCAKLKKGRPIAEVYFQLGQPVSSNGTQYTWPVGKAEQGAIRAEIINGKLHAIECNAI